MEWQINQVFLKLLNSKTLFRLDRGYKCSFCKCISILYMKQVICFQSATLMIYSLYLHVKKKHWWGTGGGVYKYQTLCLMQWFTSSLKFQVRMWSKAFYNIYGSILFWVIMEKRSLQAKYKSEAYSKTGKYGLTSCQVPRMTRWMELKTQILICRLLHLIVGG